MHSYEHLLSKRNDHNYAKVVVGGGESSTL